jgi:hypothetical protein
MNSAAISATLSLVTVVGTSRCSVSKMYSSVPPSSAAPLKNLAITPGHYWANWDSNTQHPNIIRRDTRLYWKPQVKGTEGKSVGAFVGENPGSGQSIFGPLHSGRSPIVHKVWGPGDPTLCLLLRIWQAADAQGSLLEIPSPTDYIQILNTYYFRNAKSQIALQAWGMAQPYPPYHPHPASSCRFILLGWGMGHTISPMAIAFVSLLRPFPRIIVPDSKGKVVVFSGKQLQLNCPVQPGPVMPSYVLRRRKQVLPQYHANVARELR